MFSVCYAVRLPCRIASPLRTQTRSSIPHFPHCPWHSARHTVGALWPLRAGWGQVQAEGADAKRGKQAVLGLAESWGGYRKPLIQLCFLSCISSKTTASTSKCWKWPHPPFQHEVTQSTTKHFRGSFCFFHVTQHISKPQAGQLLGTYLSKDWSLSYTGAAISSHFQKAGPLFSNSRLGPSDLKAISFCRTTRYRHSLPVTYRDSPRLGFSQRITDLSLQSLRTIYGSFIW